MALLQTCRQVREEAISIFFSENAFRVTFDFDARNLLKVWMDANSAQSLLLLDDLTIALTISEDTWDWVEEQAEETYEVEQYQYDEPDSREAWEIYGDRVVHKMFDKHLVQLVKYIKAKPHDPGCVRIAPAEGLRGERRSRIRLMCAEVRDLMLSEATTETRLFDRLRRGRRV